MLKKIISVILVPLNMIRGAGFVTANVAINLHLFIHTIDRIPQIGFALELKVTSVAFVLKPKMFSLHIQFEVMLVSPLS